MADGANLVGQEFDLEVGPVAHGGHCVARIPDGPSGGRVVFVRHALPGERVRIRITEESAGSFCRGDAVEILEASPDRVEPPCPAAGPGRCGGCDWQHVSADGQRALKATVVQEQLKRLAGVDVEVSVEALPGGLLGWRTRTVYAVAGNGRLGLRRHRSHQVVELEACPLGVDGVGDQRALQTRTPHADGVELARGDEEEVAVLVHRRSPRPRNGRGRRHPDTVKVVSGPPELHHHVAGHDFAVAAGGFWQVHPSAAATFVDAIVAGASLGVGEHALDLYAGAGLFTAVLADLVGPTGRVVGIEQSRQAVADASKNLAGLPQASVRQGRVSAELIDELIEEVGLSPSLVLLDPPRAGAGADVMNAVMGLAPRRISYVACDPASLARDLGVAIGMGWQLVSFRAFDAFPMTAHVECVAVLESASDDAR